MCAIDLTSSIESLAGFSLYVTPPVVNKPERDKENPDEDSPSKRGMSFIVHWDFAWYCHPEPVKRRQYDSSMRQLGIFRTPKTKAVVFYIGIKKTAVESGCAESASVGQTVAPGAAFQHTFVFAVLRFRDGVAGMRQVIGVHPFPYVSRHVV